MTHKNKEATICVALGLVFGLTAMYGLLFYAEWRDSTTPEPDCYTNVDNVRICDLPQRKREVYR